MSRTRIAGVELILGLVHLARVKCSCPSSRAGRLRHTLSRKELGIRSKCDGFRGQCPFQKVSEGREDNRFPRQFQRIRETNVFRIRQQNMQGAVLCRSGMQSIIELLAR